jgi:tRNA threonylcarbamoyl adenosine modification protein (Sua5/YciO/YrdC/YwlC family)
MDRVADLLDRDGVIAYPTDTLYGLGCLVSRKKAVDRIQAMKGRDPGKPMSILCADLEMLSRYTQHMDTPTFRLLKGMFPGPYTAVLPCSREVPRYLQNKRTVGLRIPDHTFCRAITAQVGEPIITTSCNLSGQPPLATSWEIQEELGHLLDLVVDCGEPAGLASTVVDLTGDEPVLLRQGAGPWPL